MGEQIHRTKFPKQRDFVRFVIRKEWSEVYRVKLGENKKLNATSIINWCNDHLTSRWTRSDGNEVYYFETIEDMTLFRFRWTGAVPEMTINK